MDRDPKVHDYFRHFEAPGLGHCYTDSGLYPDGIFHSMVRWVEEGIAPDQLVTKGKRNGILCPHPQKARFDGKGNPSLASSYACK
jgi:hypothetical protein